MRTSIKLWTALGIAISLPVAHGQPSTPSITASTLAFVGEGGEGGEAGGVLSSYQLDPFTPSTFKIDPQPVILSYITLVAKTYSAAYLSALTLQRAIDAMLENPNSATLARARRAWLAARPAYLQSEAFRYYEGPIDQAASATQQAGPEPRLNAWPLNEAVIDAVRGAPSSGLIHQLDIPISRASILRLDQAQDEADVTTGYHAIEFLLWGQDFNRDGPGTRPASDFALDGAVNSRRRTYLFELSRLLVDDLKTLNDAWRISDSQSYAARFSTLAPVEAIGRMLAGLAMLTAEELTSERLTVALDSGSQEDEHSCFSDNTHNDFKYDLRGVRNVYLGEYGSWRGTGLSALLRAHDAQLDRELLGLLSQAEKALDAIPQPFDQMLASPAGSPQREKAEVAVQALYALAAGFKRGGAALGILVIAPGV